MTTGATPVRLVGRAAGLDLSSYSEAHVTRRIGRALEKEGVGDVSRLARLLDCDPDARQRFRSSVAVSVSGLFRDPEQFELLERELLPPLLAGDRRVTVWSAGCADGSELYTVATLLERTGALDRSLLLGSDLLEENLELAKRGLYGEFLVPQSLRARARWEVRDLAAGGPPPGRWRLVLCRNVAIYLATEAKRRLHETLAAALAPDGVLLLGRSERLSRPRELGLEPAGPHAYRRVT